MLYEFLLGYSVFVTIGTIVGLEILIMRKNRGVFIPDEARDNKYKAFRFKEAPLMTRLYLWPMSFFAWHRFLFGVTTMFLTSLSCTFASMFHAESEPASGLSYVLMTVILRINAIANSYALGGAFWITTERPDVCYKKYLGPDWVPDYDKRRAATTITNHMSFVDICLLGGL